MTTTDNIELVAERDAIPDGDDAVIRLRVWGSDVIHMLPEPPVGRWLIGTASSCATRLVDRFIAPEHARLTFDGEQWWIRDCGTPCGLRQDGVLRRRFVLTPGLEVGIGATTLVAESLRSQRLHAFCQRLLG
ncbi:MAG: FHA domain-containing protein, partial [bacterium]